MSAGFIASIVLLTIVVLAIAITSAIYIERAFDTIRSTQNQNDSTKERVSDLARDAEINDKQLNQSLNKVQNNLNKTEKQQEELAKTQQKMQTDLSKLQDESQKLIKDTVEVSNQLSVGSDINMKDGSISYTDNGEEIVLDDGKVGINEPKPQKTLDVNGDMSVDGAFNLNGQKLEANSDDGVVQTSSNLKANILSFENAMKAPGGTIMTADDDEIKYNPNGDYERVSFGDTGIEAKGGSFGHVNAYGSDITIKNPDRATDTNTRRALVHNGNDEIELNYAGDYPAGARVGSSLTVDGSYKFNTNDGTARLQVQNGDLQYCPPSGSSCKKLKTN